MKKSVAIIGAGPSGLVAAKELLQEGHSVICYERQSGIGGLFHYQDDPSKISVWKTCRLSSSMLVTYFSDYFPKWREAEPFEHRHLTHQEYVNYLSDYADHFGVTNCVRFNTEVTLVSRSGEGWRVTVIEHTTGSSRTLSFDVVAICSGVHSEPHYPDFPGLELFQGQVLHAAHYRGPNSLTGRSALFVGAGESGGEIIAEASEHLDRSYLSLRRGVYVLPRFVNGVPNDYNGTRLLYSLPEFMARRTDEQAKAMHRKLRRWLFPIWLLRKMMIRGRDALLPQTRQPAGEQTRDMKIQSLICALREHSLGNLFESFATKSSAFVEAIVDGKCELRESIRRFTPSGVLFTDGSAEVVESVVLCTGFEPASVPVLEEPVDLHRLYKNCIAPDLGSSLAFIGFLRPPVGAIPPMAEMQARWFAQITSGKISLPPAAEMKRDIDARMGKRAQYYSSVQDRLPHMVDFSIYMDELADAIGAKPSLRALIREPNLLYQLHAGPFCGAHFRLQGPHKNFEMAKSVLLHAKSPVYAFRFLDLGLAECARLIGLKRYQSRLSILGPIKEYDGNKVV